MLKKVLAMLLVCGGSRVILASPARAPDAWHFEACPRVVTQDVEFTSGGAHLTGTAYLPDSGDHLPAVVVLHAASDPTRTARLYRHLREGLPAMGVAVMIYDRRGSGASSASRADRDYETLAGDAIAAHDALAKLPRIDPKRIGFWGLSQGGWLAVLAAAQSRNAAFVVSVSAPLVAAEKQMEFATTNLLTVRGYSRTDIERMLQVRRAWVGYLKGKVSRAGALDALHQAEQQPWFDLAFVPRPARLTMDPEHDSSRKEMAYDPLPAVRSVTAPLLFIYGGSDPWAPVAQSVEQLRNLSKQRPNIRYAVIADASHEMTLRTRETMAWDADARTDNAQQAPAYLMVMASWLVSREVGLQPSLPAPASCH